MHQGRNLPGRLTLALCLLAFIGIAVLIWPAINSQNTMYLDKLDQIPDIKQVENRFAFPEKGKDFCAPVVVTDSFVWLSKNGYENILGKPGARDPVVDCCRKLAELMDTRPGRGTNTEHFLTAVKSYIEQQTKYKIKSLQYEGWNKHSDQFDIAQPVPDLQWIKNGIKDKRCEWLNIGWYEFDEARNEYTRKSGHWVLPVAYGMDPAGASNQNVVIVRDPDPALSMEPRKIFINLSRIESGTLNGEHDGLPRDAKGYLKINAMGDGIADTRSKRGVGIIDGAVVLELMPQ